MTLIASWVNLEPGTQPSIWTAADSQISSGEDTLTLEGSKVLELQLTCKDLTTPVQEVYFRTSFGFAYAGSSFTAFNTYSTLNVILTNLGRSKVEGLLPSHVDILGKCRDVLKHYTTNRDRFAEICLWGFCPVSKLPFIGAIRPNSTYDGYTIQVNHGLPSQLQWVLLGDNNAKARFNELIIERLKVFEHLKDSDYWRSPFYPLREIINSHEFKGVGGNIQLSFSAVNCFKYSSVVSPIDKEKSSWTMTFRNFDVRDDFGLNVGNLFIAIDGMAMDLPYPKR